MDISNVVKTLSKIATVKNTKKEEFEIITGAKIDPNNPIKIYLINDNNVIKFCDKKNTLKYMNNIYELKSLDVKNCIASVLKIYGFSVNSGELFATIKSENSIEETFYNFIICIGQLCNMYAFFDKA